VATYRGPLVALAVAVGWLWLGRIAAWSDTLIDTIGSVLISRIISRRGGGIPF
jgi:hypothetical protein